MKKNRLSVSVLILAALTLAACGQPATSPSPSPAPSPSPGPTPTPNPPGTPAPTPTPPSNTPNPYTFAPVHAYPGAVVSSEVITVGGLIAPTTVSVQNGTLILNGRAVEGAATVQNGDTVQVQARAADAIGGQVEVRVNIGSTQATFTVITDETAPQITPNLVNNATVNEDLYFSLEFSGTEMFQWTATCDLTLPADVPCGQLTVIDAKHASYRPAYQGTHHVNVVDASGNVVASSLLLVDSSTPPIPLPPIFPENR